MCDRSQGLEVSGQNTAIGWLVSLLILTAPVSVRAANLPNHFVHLSDIDSTIIQEMRYAGHHNFMGRPIKGYEIGTCILTDVTAKALSNAQGDLKKLGYSLKVYDCYRPQKAVDDFITWSKQPKHQDMKAEFYPRVNKKDFFELGYVAEKSGHSRGSTVDLTIVPIPAPHQAVYSLKQPLVACFADHHKRFRDNSIDMGTGYDCMDELSHSTHPAISKIAYKNRQLLFWVMEKNGFVNLPAEWWHFTLKNERYLNEYFNFNVSNKPQIIVSAPARSQQLVVVRADRYDTFKATLQRYERPTKKDNWQPIGTPIPVVLGAHGLAEKNKHEGDLRTPIGVFEIGPAFGFAERNEAIKLPYQPLTNETVCVDDDTSRYYNQLVNQTMIPKPDWQHAEKMREISVYKIGAVIGYNPQHTQGAGSCIFIHIWRHESSPTAGCVAMSEMALNEVLNWLDAKKYPVMSIDKLS